MLEDAGFHEVVAEDRAEQFIAVLQRELDAVEKDKETFVSDFSQVQAPGIFKKPFAFLFMSNIVLSSSNCDLFHEDYDDIVDGWKSKLNRTSAGEQRWGLFIAKKKENMDHFASARYHHLITFL